MHSDSSSRKSWRKLTCPITKSMAGNESHLSDYQFLYQSISCQCHTTFFDEPLWMIVGELCTSSSEYSVHSNSIEK